jgi:hypothetical protein
MTAARNRLLFGTAEPPSSPVALSAASLSAELFEGGIRTLTWRGVEIVRRVTYLVRDTSWGTPIPVLAEPLIETTGDRVAVRWSGTVGVAGGTFSFDALVAMESGGRLSFEVTGTPDADLAVNRAGFVLLHPADFADLPVTIEHVDGSATEAAFPTTISPGQPFFDIRSMRYAPPGGAFHVRCTLEAELPGDPLGRFETEDQRNWGDASFKTYVGSLLKPWPYVLPAGKRFAQRVEVTIDEQRSRSIAVSHPRAASLSRQASMPPIGIGVGPGTDRLDESAIEAVARLGVGWHVVALDLRRQELLPHLMAARSLAVRAKAAIQLEILTQGDAPAEGELAEAAALCDAASLEPQAVLALPAPYLKSYQPSDTWPSIEPQAWVDAARRAFPNATIGGGMLTNFTELNRRRPSGRLLDFISHTSTAIVHAADDDSVMQALETLPHIAGSVRAVWPDVPYRLGPSSIAMRSNPYGDGLVENTGWARIPLADRDPRLRGLFGAAWTAGFAAAIAGEGLDLLALHASHGLLGLVGEYGLVPAYHVVAALAAAVGCPQVSVDIARPLAALAWQTNDDIKGLVANLTAQPQPCPRFVTAARVLDEATAKAAAADLDWSRGALVATPVMLGPYAVAFCALSRGPDDHEPRTAG